METRLTTIDKSAISQMPIGLQKYALAKQGEIISKMSIKFAVTSIYKVLGSTLVDIGLKNIEHQEDVILNISESVYNLINDRYKTLTIEELKLACLNGSLDEYSKYYGVNLKTVSDWLKGYSNDEKKKKAMAEWNRLIDFVQIKEKTPEQKEAIIRDGCLHAFFDYKSNPLNEMVIGHIFYDYLKDKGLLILPIEVHKKISINQRLIYENELKVSNRKKVVSDAILNELISSLSENKTLINRCKRAGLKWYFDELIKHNKNLEL